jgi:hypothetical protein
MPLLASLTTSDTRFRPAVVMSDNPKSGRTPAVIMLWVSAAGVAIAELPGVQH